MTVYSYHATYLLIGGLQRVGLLFLLSITHSFIWLHQYKLLGIYFILCAFELHDHSSFYWLVYPLCSLRLFHLDSVFGWKTSITSPVLRYFPPPPILPETLTIFLCCPRVEHSSQSFDSFQCTVVLIPKTYMEYSHCFKVKEYLLKHDRVFELMKSQ